jgi:hypothetical protein
MTDSEFDRFCDMIADQIDDEATCELLADSHVDWELERDYRLDANRRVGRKFARVNQIEEMLAYEERRDELTKIALDHRREELEKLRPYFVAGGRDTTKEQAVAAYKADHS